MVEAPGWSGVGAVTPASTIKSKKLSESFKGFKVVLHGREETWKTGSSLFFPKPEIMDLEIGVADLAPFFRGIDILFCECAVMREMLIAGKPTYTVDKVESLMNFEQAFGDAIRNPESSTVIVDSVTELYDWAMEFMKKEGKGLDAKQVMSSTFKKLMERKDMSTFDFGISNTIMHDTIMKGLLCEKNFVLISQDEQVWENNQPTDKYKMSGHKKVSFWMPIKILMTIEYSPNKKVKNYFGTIEKFRGQNCTGEKQLLMSVTESEVGGKKTFTTKIEKTVFSWLSEIRERNQT